MKQQFNRIGILLSFSLVAGCAVASPQTLYEQAMQSLEQGHYQRGINRLDRVIELSPELAEAYVNRGIAYDELGNHAAALKDYNQAIQINVNLASAYYHRANTYNKSGDLQKAIADYSHVIQLQANDARAYGNRGSTYLSLGETDKAVRDLEKAAALFSFQGDSQREQIARRKIEEIHQGKE